MSADVVGDPPLRRRVLFWVALAAIAAGAAVTVTDTVLSMTMNPPEATLIVTTALVGHLVVVAAIALVLDRAPRLSPARQLVALGWGMLVAITLAGQANTAWSAAFARLGLGSISDALVAPFDEETTKLLGVLVVLTLVLPRPVRVLDGLVAGFVCGAGFDVVENVGYALNAATAAATDDAAIAAAWESTTGRLLDGFTLHGLWTGIAGAGLAFALGAAAPLGRRIAVAAGLILAAVALHLAWDLPELTVSSAAQSAITTSLYIVSVLLFGLCWWWGWRGGRRRPGPIGPPADVVVAAASPRDAAAADAPPAGAPTLALSRREYRALAPGDRPMPLSD